MTKSEYVAHMLAKTGSRRLVVAAESAVGGWRAARAWATGLAMAWAARGAARQGVPLAPGTVLVLRLDEIGDGIMGLPLLEALKARWPSCRLVVACKPGLEPLYALAPAVDLVVTHPGLRGGNMGSLAVWLASRDFARRSLTPLRPDICVNARWGFDMAGAGWLALYSGAPCRVGYSEKVSPRKAALNRGFDRAYSVVVPPTALMHQVEQGMALAAFVGAPATGGFCLRLALGDRAWAESVLANGPWLAVAPGAGHSRRLWPEERYAALARHARAYRGLKPVMVGGAADRAAAARILDAAGGGVNLCGEASLPRSLAALERCDALVGSDSAPAHMAAAVGTPCLVVSAFAMDGDPADDISSPARFCPWGVPCRVLRPARQQVPCINGCQAPGPHCILQVSADEACAALDALLAEVPSKRPA